MSGRDLSVLEADARARLAHRAQIFATEIVSPATLQALCHAALLYAEAVQGFPVTRKGGAE